MGGKLEISSKLGEGSTFYFTLDLEKQDLEEQKQEYLQYPELKIGLVLPEKNIERQADKNLEAYVTFLGAHFTIYYDEEIYNTPKEDLPDLLFIDHRYARRENELQNLADIDTKVVLLASGHIRNESEEAINKLAKIIYKPANFSKISKLLEETTQVEAKTIEVSDTTKVSKSDMFIGRHALVAEDNEINQKLITKILNDFGLTVTLVKNGEEAVDLRKQNDYDLIFMDIQMPVLGGIDATKQILHFEKSAGLAHTPIIALTANALQGDREKYINAGMDNYTSKPINIDQIQFLLETYLAKHKSDNSIEPDHSSKSNTKEKKDTFGILGDTSTNHDREIEGRDRLSTKTTDNVPSAKSHAPLDTMDVLLYKESPLASDIYQKILANLGYTVTAVLSEDQFLNALNREPYRYVLIDGSLMQDDDDCLIADFIKETGAVPVTFSDDSAEKYHCCKSIGLHPSKQKLDAILN
jgi:CheY-like chemotaxis protein